MINSINISIPRETVNDDFVTIVSWNHCHGDKVKKGKALATVETSKTAFDIETETDGYLEIIVPIGEEVAVGEVIGRLHSDPIPLSPEKEISQFEKNLTESVNAKISKKAQVLIDRNKIDASVFSGQDFVREADVIRYLEELINRRVDQTESFKKGEDPRSKKIKGLFSDAKLSAQERGWSVFQLVFNYFIRNYLLGLLVRIAPRGINLFLHRLRGIKMGKGVFIDPTAILETAYPEYITIGNDVRITAHAVIMTHIKAPHYLRQTGIMPVVKKPVILEDHCFIGVNAVIMPGITVGRASVVASGSVVLTNVPPYVMVAGNPAKVIKNFPSVNHHG